MNIPLISIIVPIYKVEKYLRKCIDSILISEWKDFEIILVNDGSPDGCAQICDAYKEKDGRVKVIHQNNKGVTGARIAGCVIANGEYIWCVDPDDYIDSQILFKVSNIIALNSPDIIIFDHINIKPKKQYRFYNFLEEKLYEGKELINLKNRMLYDSTRTGINYGNITNNLWDKIIKREIFLLSQKDVPNNIRVGEDLAVSIKSIDLSEKVYYLKEVGYYYIYHQNSAMNIFREDEFENKKILFNYLKENLSINYTNQINVFIFNSFFMFLTKLAYNKSLCKNFVSLVRQNYDFSIEEAISRMKISKLKIKERIKILLIKNKNWKLIYILLKQ